MDNQCGDAVLLAYYQGAACPALRIDVRRLEMLEKLSDVFRELCSGSLNQFSMHDLHSAVIAPPLTAVTFAVTLGDESVRTRRKVSQLIGTDGMVSVRWVQTAAEWEDTSGLIEGLLKTANRCTPGHQFLTDGAKDGILIEVAFDE